MKSNISRLVLIALTTMVIAGCQRQPQSESPSPANPPSMQPNTNSTGPTNQSQANPPAASGLSQTKNPASASQ